MFKKINNNITTKLMSLIILSIFSINMLLETYNYFHTRKMELNLLKENGIIILDRIANNIAEPVWSYDLKRIETILQQEIINHDVFAIIIKNEKGKIVIAKIKNNRWEVSDFQSNDNDRLKKYGILFKKELIFNEGLIGILDLYMTDYFIKQKLKDRILTVIFNSVALTLLTVLILYFIVNSIIIKPLKKLESIVISFSDKNFNLRVPVKNNDEIGRLSSKFNSMADALQEYSQNLERLVKKRTEELQIAHDLIKRELMMARKIQLAIIPKIFPENSTINFSGAYLPMEDVGGDFYDIYPIDNHLYGVVIADVSGHGVPAALITMMAKVLFSTESIRNKSVENIVCNVNSELCKVISDIDNYLTAFYCIINTELAELSYINAGHPDAYIIKENGNIVRLSSKNFVIGKISELNYFSEKIKLEDKDKVVLYTDGITEARNKKGEFLGDNTFVEILLRNRNLNLKEYVDKIIKEVNDFMNGETVKDDITLLVLEISYRNQKLTIDFNAAVEKSLRK